jgi:hypothetical protein
LSFKHEVRSNGNTVGTLSPRLGVLLRACGMAQTQVTGASGTIGTAAADAGNTGTITFAKTTAYAGTLPRTVTLTCTTGGASGTAKVTVSAPAVGDLEAISVADVAVTDATPIALAGSATVTPTVGTNLATDDVWTILLTPAGYEYTPISDAFESVTMSFYVGGALHKMTGARGTFSVDAPGGDYAKFSFEFTGNYVAAANSSSLPTPTFETTVPQQVELANLYVSDAADVNVTTLIASKFNIDIANTVSIAQDVNRSDAYAGARITARAPKLSFDPEFELVDDYDFWGKLSAGTSIEFGARVGTTKGNVVRFVCPAIQYSNLQYNNRDGIRAVDITANLGTDAGDNELKIAFN